MGKKIINSTGSPEDKELSLKSADDKKSLAKLSSKLLFEPTALQRKVKAKFWTKFQSGPLTTPDSISMPLAQEVTGEARLKEWWSQEGFKEWFVNREETREKLKYLFDKSLDAVENILDDPEANANAKVNLVKLLAEINGFVNKNKTDKFADEEINKMNESQLTAFLEKKGITVRKELILQAKKEDLVKEDKDEDGSKKQERDSEDEEDKFE